MIRIVLAAGAMALALALAMAGAADAQQWKTYKNVRFGTQGVYPADLFSPLEPPANGAGLGFETSDGASLVIQGMFNGLDDKSPKALAREYYGPDSHPNVAYEASGENWFVLSGTRGGTVYYEKVILSCKGDVVNALTIEYPVARKSRYDGLVERIEKGFKPGRGEDRTENCP
jgi:hypothetical protein